MLLLVGTPPRMTRSVSRRGEASASPTPSSLPLVITRRSNVSESACVSVTKSPPVLPSKPEPPDLFPVEQIEPLFETFPPPDPPFKTPSPPEPPDPPLKAPSPMCPPEPPDPPDVLKVKIITIADPPDHDHSGAPDLFSFTLKIAEPPHVSGTMTSSSACLLLVSLGVNFVMPWLPHTAVCRVQFYYILWRKPRFPPLLLGFVLKDTVFVTPLIESKLVGFCCTSSLTELNSRSQSPPLPQYDGSRRGFTHLLPQYEAFRLWFSLPLPQCEVLLPQYEVHLPQYEVVIRNLLFLRLLQYICMLVFLTNISGISYRKLGDDQFHKTQSWLFSF